MLELVVILAISLAVFLFIAKQGDENRNLQEDKDKKSEQEKLIKLRTKLIGKSTCKKH